MEKRILSFSLALALLISALPLGLGITAYAETPETEIESIMERETQYVFEDSPLYLSSGILDGILTPSKALDLEKRIYNAAVDCKTAIDVTNLGMKFSSGNMELIYSFIDYCKDKYPELYHLRSRGLRSIGSTVVQVTLGYYDGINKASYDKMNKDIDAAITEKLGDILDAESTLTDTELMLLLHDRIALMCQYDEKNYEKYEGAYLAGQNPNPGDYIPFQSFTPYGVFIDGVAVCEGYSKAYQMLLDDLGINNRLCASNSLVHVWNIVELDGETYHIDVTWDDPTPNHLGRVTHTNFLRSSDGIYDSGHTATDYDTTPDSTVYDNYFWQDSNSAFTYHDGDIYYVNSAEEIKQWNGLNGSSDPVILDTGSEWSWGGRPYTRLAKLGNNLYFSTPNSINRLNFSTDPASSREIFEPLRSNGSMIFGFDIVGEKARLEVAENPNYDIYEAEELRQEFTVDTRPLFELNYTEKNDLSQGDTFTLELLNFDDNGTGAVLSDAVFSSTNPELVSINATTGEVEILGTNGYAVLSCTVMDAVRYCEVYVLEPHQTIFSDDIISVDLPEYVTYTGSEITLDITLYHGEDDLSEGVDYTVSYTNNIDAGTAGITIEGMGKYVGAISRTFTINPRSVSGFEEAFRNYASSQSITYSGSAKKLSFKVENITFNQGTDYTIDYVNNVNAGTATALLTGRGNYIGTISATFTIKPRSITNATMSKVSDRAYTGSRILPSVNLTLDGKQLVLGRDYIVSGSNNIYTGRATSKVIGRGNYTGSLTYYFIIYPAKVTGLKQSSATYNSIKLSWTRSKSGTGYAVKRATSKNGSYKTIKLIKGLKYNYYTDKKLSSGKTYYYKVVAYKTISGKNYGGVESTKLKTTTATKKPTISSYKAKSGRKAYISWKKVSSASGYRLYMSTKKSSGYKSIYTGSKRSYTKKSLKKGKTYYFKVRTYRTVNGKKFYSKYSNVKKVKIKK